MGILFVASEIFPYAKSGGLADVAHSLPEALKEYEKVYTIMPLYDIINRKKFNLVYSGLSFDYWLCGVRHQFDIFYKEDSQEELFIYNPILCARTGLYSDAYGDFGDNGLRFGLFSYAIIETMLQMKLSIDTIHLNDWQTSLVAILAKTKYNLKQKIILTIHNLAYQGIFHKSLMNELELCWESNFKFEGLEYFDKVNLLKGGIFFSDQITTVSHSYANEIQTPFYGHGLEETLQKNNYKLSGILNGISNEVFNPKTDQNIYKNFDLQTYTNKIINKTELLKELQLENENKPLFVFIGRFTNQKGVDLILNAFTLFKDLEANFIILGNGENNYNHRFSQVTNKYKNIKILIGYDEALSRKLYAGADFLLMPSTFEPCGLNQMIALCYGTLPIVSKTGGLQDTVTDFTDISQSTPTTTGIGITFQEHNLFWFLHAITKALSLYANKEKFENFLKHNMAVDNSWKHSATLYLNLYK